MECNQTALDNITVASNIKNEVHLWKNYFSIKKKTILSLE